MLRKEQRFKTTTLTEPLLAAPLPPRWCSPACAVFIAIVITRTGIIAMTTESERVTESDDNKSKCADGRFAFLFGRWDFFNVFQKCQWHFRERAAPPPLRRSASCRSFILHYFIHHSSPMVRMNTTMHFVAWKKQCSSKWRSHL